MQLLQINICDGLETFFFITLEHHGRHKTNAEMTINSLIVTISCFQALSNQVQDSIYATLPSKDIGSNGVMGSKALGHFGTSHSYQELSAPNVGKFDRRLSSWAAVCFCVFGIWSIRKTKLIKKLCLSFLIKCYC